MNRASNDLQNDIALLGLSKGAKVYIQIIKSDDLLKLYLANDDGTYTLFNSYPICA